MHAVQVAIERAATEGRLETSRLLGTMGARGCRLCHETGPHIHDVCGCPCRGKGANAKKHQRPASYLSMLLRHRGHLAAGAGDLRGRTEIGFAIRHRALHRVPTPTRAIHEMHIINHTYV